MNTIKVAIPSNTPGGLTSERSEHFGHCDLFTLIDVTEGKITGVEILDNIDHGAGGCIRPVELLRENKVDTIVVAGMGKKPLEKFSAAGIKVFFAPRNSCNDVSSVADGFINNLFTPMDKKHACKGHGNCHHGERV